MQLQLVFSVPPRENGSVLVRDNIYGYDVISRPNVIEEGARRTFLMVDAPLPEGRLHAFFCYIHQALDTPGLTNRSNVSLFLQIWRGEPINSLEYQLVYEKKIYVNASSPHGLLYTVHNWPLPRLNSVQN